MWTGRGRDNKIYLTVVTDSPPVELHVIGRVIGAAAETHAILVTADVVADSQARIGHNLVADAEWDIIRDEGVMGSQKRDNVTVPVYQAIEDHEPMLGRLGFGLAQCQAREHSEEGEESGEHSQEEHLDRNAMNGVKANMERSSTKEVTVVSRRRSCLSTQA